MYQIAEHMKDTSQKLSEDIAYLKNQLAPISKVYESFNTFTNVTSWFFKFLIIPLSILVGIWYELKHLIKG